MKQDTRNAFTLGLIAVAILATFWVLMPKGNANDIAGRSPDGGLRSSSTALRMQAGSSQPPAPLSDPCAVCTYSDDGPDEEGDLVGGAANCDPWIRVDGFPIQNGDCVLDNQQECTVASKLCKTKLLVGFRLPPGWTLDRLINDLHGTGDDQESMPLGGPFQTCKVGTNTDILTLDCGDKYFVQYTLTPPKGGGFSVAAAITLTCSACPGGEE